MGRVHFRMSPANKRGTVAGTTRGGLTSWWALIVDTGLARHGGRGPGGQGQVACAPRWADAGVVRC